MKETGYRGLLGLVLLSSGLLYACQETPDDKVVRRATLEEMPGVRVAKDKPAPTEAVEAQPQPQPQVLASPVKSCEKLIEQACEALGAHSDECQEARALLPHLAVPAHQSACTALLVTEIEPRQDKGKKRLNPCRRLIRAVCKLEGGGSWQCKQAKADASRLWRTGQRQACLGDLLIVKARALLSAAHDEE